MLAIRSLIAASMLIGMTTLAAGAPPEPPPPAHDPNGPVEPPEPPEGRGRGPAESGRGPAGAPGRNGEPAGRGTPPAPGMGQLQEIRLALNVTDEEWAVLMPRIQAIQEAQREVERATRGARGPARGGPDRGGANRAGETAQTPTLTPVQQAQMNLQTALASADSSVEQLRTAIEQLRAARRKSAETLSKAQSDLVQLLTVRQEAVLLQFGIL